jgi:hypothetical protein
MSDSKHTIPPHTYLTPGEDGTPLFVSDVVKTIESRDATDVAGTFVYNYFQRDENENGTPDVDTDILATSDVFSRQSLPRYIKIDWGATDNNTDPGVAVPLTTPGGPNTIADAQARGLLNYEDDEESSRYTAINLQDVDSSYEFYNSSESASRPPTVSADRSQPSSEDAIGYSTSYINNAIHGMNTLSLSAIISSEISSLIADRILVNELSPFYNDITAATTNKIDTGTTAWSVAEDAERLLNSRQFISYHEQEISGDWDGDAQHVSKLVGYIIEKRESTYENEITIHDNIHIESPDIRTYLDTNIRYGSQYQYKIRSVHTSGFTSTGTAAYDEDITRYSILVVSKGSESIQVTAKEFDPPEPPENLQFRFYSGFDSLRIGWDYPHIRTKDVKRVQIYRRSSILHAFELLREYDFDDSDRKEYSPASGNESNITIIEKTWIDANADGIANEEDEMYVRIAPGFYYDVEFNESSNYIYALATIDAHGLTSTYSDQFVVSYDNLTNKVKTKYISSAGAMKAYPNEKLEIDMLPDVIKDINYSHMNVYMTGDVDIVKDSDDSEEEIWVLDPDGGDHGIRGRGYYNIQAISIEQQQSDLFKFVIK